MNSLAEVAKLIGGLSIAIMSMSVVTYALAVPRLQTALSNTIKSTRESRCPPGRAWGLFGALRFLFCHYVLSHSVEV